MANKDPSRTEKPTGRRLNETRSEGRVLYSQDVNSFALILAGLLLCLLTYPLIKEGFDDSLYHIRDVDCRQNWTYESIQGGALLALQITGKILAPICFGLCFAAAMIMRLQVGKFFDFKPLKWKFDGFNPASGIMSLKPNSQNLINFGLTGAKVTLVAYFVYLEVSWCMDEIIALPTKPLVPAMLWAAKKCYILVFKILAVFLFIAIVDYIVKRKKYIDDLMMTKQEVKDEVKNSEGDPRVKAKIRQKMRELFRMRMMNAVPRADVVITNPTHVAVALKYEAGMIAPMILAKGLRKRAERIKALAKIHNIPTVEAPPLARSLYRNCKEGQYILPEFFAAVAAILAKLQREGRRNFMKKDKLPKAA